MIPVRGTPRFTFFLTELYSWIWHSFLLLTEAGASALVWLRSVCYRVGMSEWTQWCLPPGWMLLPCLTLNTGGQSEEGIVNAVFFSQQM